MNTDNDTRSGGVRALLGCGMLILAAVMFAGCKDPEPPDPAALIPEWRLYYNREVGVEFRYPYNLELEVSSGAEQVKVDLLWVGQGTSVFKMESSSGSDGGGAGGSQGDRMVGGRQASQSVIELDGGEVQRLTVVSGGRTFTFTGSGTTFDKVLDSVKFTE